MPRSASPITHVPVKTPMFDGPAFSRTANLGIGATSKAQDPTPVTGSSGNLSRPWILFFESLQQAFQQPIIVGFIINTGATGTNVGPMLPSPFDGTADVVTVIIKASDPSVPLTFRINQSVVNSQGLADEPIDIFEADPTIPAATESGTVLQLFDLTSSPLPIAYGDVFSIDILSGSSAWQFTAVVQTATAASTSGQE